ncbi:MAG: hypothetical protein JOZ69_04100 [Myxococcales bacterium]|nr:hypothetical protein [Myxococcales bacterium]
MTSARRFLPGIGAALLAAGCGLENVTLDDTTRPRSDSPPAVAVTVDAESPRDAESDGAAIDAGEAEPGAMDGARDANMAEGALEDAGSGGSGDDARSEDAGADASVVDAARDAAADAHDAGVDAHDAALDVSVRDGVARDAPPDTTSVDAEDGGLGEE